MFIGWFLRSLAGSSLHQQMMRDLLRNFVASDLMSLRPEVVPGAIPLASLVQDHFMRLRFGSYPVVEGDRLLGMVTLEGVKRGPKSDRGMKTAADAMTPLDECVVIAPGTSMEAALQEMSRESAHGRALVETEDGSWASLSSDCRPWRAWWVAAPDLVSETRSAAPGSGPGNTATPDARSRVPWHRAPALPFGE